MHLDLNLGGINHIQAIIPEFLFFSFIFVVQLIYAFVIMKIGEKSI